MKAGLLILICGLLTLARGQFPPPTFRPFLRPSVQIEGAPTPRPNPGRYNPGNSGRYNPGNDGKYRPDNSGRYRPDGSGIYKHDDNPYKGQNIPAKPYSGSFDRGTYTPDRQPLIPYVPFKDRYPYVPFKDQYPYAQKPDQYPYSQKPDQNAYTQKPERDQYPRRPVGGEGEKGGGFPGLKSIRGLKHQGCD